MRELDQGTWRVGHPEQIVATFFFPLPEPLPLPQGEALRSYHSIEKVVADLLSDGPPGLILQRVDGSGEIVPYSTLTSPRADGAVNFSNKFVLNSSVLVHFLRFDPRRDPDLEAADSVAKAASLGQMRPDELQEMAEARRTALRQLLDAPEIDAFDHHTISVAECAVELRIVGQRDVLPVMPFVLDPSYAAAGTSDLEVVSNDVSFWHWIVGDGEEIQEPIVRRVALAFDIALEAVRDIQRAIYASMQLPLTLVTQQRLPSMLPFLLRTAESIATASVRDSGTLLLNFRLFDSQQGKVADASEMQRVVKARQSLDQGTFGVHLDLRREAMVMLHRNGDTRAAAIYAAIAAESLLTELLLHLMWEEKRTPEEVANSWTGGLDTRVKTEFYTRLRGNWNPTGSGPIGRWNRTVSALRHRVVHAGYTPSFEEAKDAIEAVRLLVEFLCDRLAANGVVTKYPRTAMVLVNENGLRRRNAWVSRVDAVANSRHEPNWADTFHRWREAWRRLVRDRAGEIRRPDLARAVALAIVSEDDQISWILHDRRAYLATPATLSADSYALLPRTEQMIERARQGGQTGVISIHVEGITAEASNPGQPWVEEYHLHPMAGVMVDKSDFYV